MTAINKMVEMIELEYNKCHLTETNKVIKAFLDEARRLAAEEAKEKATGIKMSIENVGKDLCPYCDGPIAIRNPTGKCDHLYYPDNVNKNLLTPKPSGSELIKELKEWRDKAWCGCGDCHGKRELAFDEIVSRYEKEKK